MFDAFQCGIVVSVILCIVGILLIAGSDKNVPVIRITSVKIAILSLILIVVTNFSKVKPR